MDVTQIPFAKHIGIERKEEGVLKLEPTAIVQNHIQSIHASAQYALAETQTGLYLQEAFPHLVGKVGAVLRSASVKYKHPATSTIYTAASIDEALKEKFIRQLAKKGIASIKVNCTIKSNDDIDVMIGEFTWFVQSYAE